VKYTFDNPSIIYWKMIFLHLLDIFYIYISKLTIRFVGPTNRFYKFNDQFRKKKMYEKCTKKIWEVIPVHHMYIYQFPKNIHITCPLSIWVMFFAQFLHNSNYLFYELEKWSIHSFLTTALQQADVAGNILLFYCFLFFSFCKK
jgi:hypothetical protein